MKNWFLPQCDEKRNFYLFRLGGVLTQFGLISGPGDEKKAIIKHNKTVKKKARGVIAAL